MTHLLSPSVTLREYDRTISVQADNTSVAGFAGDFNWGPAEQITRIENVAKLEQTFGLQGTANTDFLIAAQFLGYSNNLRCVRAISGTAVNATWDGTGLLIKNDNHYYSSYDQGQAAVGEFVAKFPGTKGNGLEVAYCDKDGYRVAKTGSTSGVTLTSTGLTSHNVGDKIYVGGVHVATIITITNATTAILDATLDPALSSGAFTVEWKYADQFNIAPDTSVYAADKGSSEDELHVLVVDTLGKFSGSAGSILERYEFVSKASDAKLDNNESNFYKNVINAKSKYIRWTDFPASSNWGTTAGATSSFTALAGGKNVTLAGGVDGTVSVGNKITAFQKFSTDGADEVGILIAGEADAALANGVIAVATGLKYTIACVSPAKAAVVDNAGDEVDDILSFKSSLTATDQLFVDSGYKLAYDQYNARFVNLPLCADIAGLMVKIEAEDGISASPAREGNSYILNCVKLAFNPTEPERDVLYANSVNPVVTFPGSGTVLFGDRSAITRPSAFRYIGARRMFNLVKKSLAKASRSFLFIRNTQGERARYANTIRAYLNTLKDNQDIEDFRVVVDNNNNTPDQIAAQVLVADVYIKPIYSVNWILINMHAIQTGASFTESSNVSI